MKLVLVSDLHSNRKCIGFLQSIMSREKPEGVVISGDITVNDDKAYLGKIFEIISSNNIAGFLIWGNADMTAVQAEILTSPFNLHLKKRVLRDWNFFGLSYMEEYPQFDTSQIKDSIFVTHRPPIKQNLEIASANSPRYHISGHLHKAASVKKSPSTKHIQVPTLIDGRYANFDPVNGSVNFLKIEEK